MKKNHIISIAAALLLMLGLSSCKKDYTCECTTTTTGIAPIVTTSTVHGTAKSAKDGCEAGSSTQSNGYGTVTVVCKII